MIATLLHFLRLAFATSGLWTLYPTIAPDADNALFIATPKTLYIEDSGRTLVTCAVKTDCTNGVCVEHFERCEVTK